MTASYVTAPMNPHITSLESAFTDAHAPVEWLVIAHNDSRMVRSLAGALRGESAVVLEVSEDTWDFQGPHLPQAIDWALEQGGITNVVLVGHSQAGGPESRASGLASEGHGDSQSSYDRLIAGVHRANSRNRDTQSRFASQVRQMSHIPCVSSRVTDGKLAVYGLFYRAESGVFLIYDAVRDHFRPLVP